MSEFTEKLMRGEFSVGHAANVIEDLDEQIDRLNRIRVAARAVVQDFPAIQEKHYNFDGLRDKTYLSPSASMIDSKLIVALRAALHE